MVERLLSWGRRGTAAATIAARLSFENITKKYGQTEVLSGIDLDVPPAEVVCLLGPSGGGKSTLLRIAAGIETPSSGEVLFNHRPMNSQSYFMPPEQRGIGLMFQDYALFPHMTIIDNVMFGLRGMERKLAIYVAETALERVGLAHYAKDFPHVLSGGEQQRVALARAIAPRPGVLLMDEPFSGLDVRLRDQMREETLAILRETRATCLIVTHQGEEAMRMGDQIAVIQNGVIVQTGPTKEVYETPVSAYVARLFSELNEVPVIAKNKKIETPLGTFPAKNISDGQRGIVCFRHRMIEVCDISSENSVVGRVIDRKFLGDTVVLSVAMNGLDAPLQVRMGTSEAPNEGDEIGVRANVETMLYFPA